MLRWSLLQNAHFDNYGPQEVILDLMHNKLTFGSYLCPDTIILFTLLLIILILRFLFKNGVIYHEPDNPFIGTIAFSLWVWAEFYFRIVTVLVLEVFIIALIVFYCRNHKLGEEQMWSWIIRLMDSEGNYLGFFWVVLISLWQTMCIFIPRPYIYLKNEFKSYLQWLKFSIWLLIPISLKLCLFWGILTLQMQKERNPQVIADFTKFFNLFHIHFEKGAEVVMYVGKFLKHLI